MTSRPPLVSIVLPTYNRSGLLRRSIASVLAQTFDDFELIVVDDCSQEDIKAVVDAFADPRLHYVRRSMNGGAPAARNTGVEQARGEYLAFQDSDDEWLIDKLEIQLREIRSGNGNTDMLICGMFRVCPTHVFSYPASHLLPTAGGDSQSAVKRNAIAFTQTWLVRRKLLLQAGRFDEALKIWDDWDMLLRLSAIGTIRFLSQPLVLSHHTPGSVSSELPARARDLTHVIRKHSQLATPDKSFLARLHYLRGRFQLLCGEMSAARADLRKSSRLDIWQMKAPVLLMLSFIGHGAAIRFLNTPPEADS